VTALCAPGRIGPAHDRVSIERIVAAEVAAGRLDRTRRRAISVI
jgi:hypothetical protein